MCMVPRLEVSLSSRRRGEERSGRPVPESPRGACVQPHPTTLSDPHKGMVRHGRKVRAQEPHPARGVVGQLRQQARAMPVANRAAVSYWHRASTAAPSSRAAMRYFMVVSVSGGFAVTFGMIGVYAHLRM